MGPKKGIVYQSLVFIATSLAAVMSRDSWNRHFFFSEGAAVFAWSLAACFLLAAGLSFSPAARERVFRRWPSVFCSGILLAATGAALVAATLPAHERYEPFLFSFPAAVFLAVAGNAVRDRGLFLARGTMAVFGLALAFITCDAGFRTFFLEEHIPWDEESFARKVSADWPEPRAFAKPDGVKRLVGLSDSFGRVGGARNYNYLVESALRERGQRAEMVNLSVAECEPREERLMLERFGGKFAPDLVLHGFFIGNDFGSGFGTAHKYANISLRVESSWRRFLPRRMALLRWLHKYYLARKATAAARSAPDAETAVAAGQSPPTFADDDFLLIERRRVDFCLKSVDPERDWAEAFEELCLIREHARSLGAAYVLVIHPDEFQVDPNLRRRVAERYGLDENDYDWERPQTALMNYAFRNGIPCLDLLPIFRAESAHGPLFLPRDTHYNDTGNLVAAKAIARFLETLPDSTHMVPLLTTLTK